MDYTTNYNLVKPAKSQKAWDILINDNFDKIDNEIKNTNNKIGDISQLDNGSVVAELESHATALAEMAKKTAYNIDFSQLDLTGNTDVTDIIQNIIDYATSHRISSINFPHGIYKITHTIFINDAYARCNINFSNSVIRGDGNIEDYVNGYMFMFNSTDGVSPLIEFQRGGIFRNIRLGGMITGIKGIFLADMTTMDEIYSSQLYNTITIADAYIDNLILQNIHIGNNLGTDYAIVNVNGKGDNWIIQDIETNSDNSGCVKLIKLSGYTSNVTIKRVVNGIIEINNTNAFLEKIYCEVGGLILKNTETIIEDSILYDQLETLTTANGEVLSGYPIEISDINGYSRNITLKNIVFTYPHWRDKGVTSELKSLLISESYKGEILVVKCYNNIVRSHDSKTAIMIYYRKNDGSIYKDDIVNSRLFGDFTILSNKKIQIKDLLINLPSSIDNSVSANYIDTNIIPGESVYYEHLGDGSTVQHYGMKFFNISGSYSVNLIAWADFTRRIGVKLSAPLNIEVDNTQRKIIEVNYDFDTNNMQLQTFITNPDKIVQRLLISNETHKKIYYNGNDFNGRIAYTQVSPPSEFSTNYYEKLIKNIDNVICYGTATPTLGTWTKGDRIINTNIASGQVKSWICSISGTPGTWISEGTY